MDAGTVDQLSSSTDTLSVRLFKWTLRIMMSSSGLNKTPCYCCKGWGCTQSDNERLVGNHDVCTESSSDEANEARAAAELEDGFAFE